MTRHIVPRWFGIAAASASLALLLAACAAPTGGSPQAGPGAAPSGEPAAAETPAADNTPVDTPPPPTRRPTPETDPTPGGSVGGGNPESLAGQVPAAALAWETDWTQHTVPYSEIFSGGVPRDGIRSIDDPEFVSFDEAAEWLADTEPVMALEIDGDARAYPLGILTRHEIANDVVGGMPVAVTFCPLCNSALVFDRRVGGEVYEFGVSGLLRHSDLIMYDRTTESLWQQFTGEGIVGAHAGDQLTFIPSSTVSFADFREAYPEGVVLAPAGRGFGTNPYAGYDQAPGRPFLFFGELDERLPPVMRVVGIEVGDAHVAYPYDVLQQVRVVNDTVNGQDVAIFFRYGTNSALGGPVIAQAEDVGAATVYDPVVDGERLTFTLDGETFTDEQTGSTWNLLGQATAGELAGTRLTPLTHSDHFWFSWAAFFPETDIYQAAP